MITDTNSKPFPPTPIDPIVEQARATLLTNHRAMVAAKKVEFEARAEAAWQRHERERHDTFIQKYRYENEVTYPYRYGAVSDGAAVRLATPIEDRIKALGEHGYFEELLYVILARSPKQQCSVAHLQESFAAYMDAVGDTRIVETFPEDAAREVVHARGLSKQLADLLTGTWLVDVSFGEVRWNDREHNLAEY
jgi:hypothetical protein